ncbi:MAG: glycosyltransferase [Pseudoclavibacter sp.]|nr:glycosyltransferase [Pseudoclavibacter sp.]
MSTSEPAPPRVTVLLATHQGERFLREQLDSILGQRGRLRLSVLVSDDGSSDGTRAIVREYAARDGRVRMLPSCERMGAPAPNFYRLLAEADPDSFDYVGFADQDDVWMPDKLARHIALLAEHGADGVSSNVTAFEDVAAPGAETRRVLIRKDYPQRRADYLFETPGPGSSFLLTARLARMVRSQLERPDSPARQAVAHDWLIYALARAAGLRWHIDPASTVDYRQHDANAFGANAGWRQALKRVQLTASRWHREQVRITVAACVPIASPEQLPRLQWFHEVLGGSGPFDRLRLVRRAGEFRRRPRDRWILAGLILLGLW